LKTAVSFLLFFLLLIPRLQFAYAQEFEQISTHQGLPHNVVSSLYQDREGYIWIGTYNGLCRYDGNKLKIYTNIFDSTRTQDWHQAIERIFEDSKGNIWVGTKGGRICCFVRKTQTWKIIPANLDRIFITTCFFEDSAHHIWIGSTNGTIGKVTGNKIRFLKVANEAIRHITAMGSNNLIIVSVSGIRHLNLDTEVATDITLPGLSEEYTVYCESGNGILFFEKPGCVQAYDLNKRAMLFQTPIPSNIRGGLTRKFVASQQNSFYLTNMNLIYEYDASGRLISSGRINDNTSYDQTNEIINCLLADNTGVLWIGTFNGLFKIDRNKYSFRKHARSQVTGRLTGNYVRTVYADGNDDIWVGLRHGSINTLSYDDSSQTYKLRSSYKMNKQGKLADEYTTNAIIQLKDGRILAGCVEGLFIADKRSQKLQPLLNASETPTYIWSLYEDTEGWLWIGTKGDGLHLLHLASGKRYHYKHSAFQKQSISGDEVWNIYGDRNGNTWLLTNNSASKVPKGSEKHSLSFTYIPLEPKTSEPVPTWNILEDSTARLWVSTTGYGLYTITSNGTHVEPETAFPNKVISGLIRDKKGRLWISTMNGLFRYDPRTKAYTSYDESDGLISNDFNFKAAAISARDHIFMGTKMGLVSFHPDSVRKNRVDNIPIHVSSLAINGKDRTGLLYTNSELQLGRGENAIQFGFSIPEYSKQRAHTYRYILNGFDKNWNTTNADQPLAMYTNIPPGHYSLVVEGSADGITWSRKKAMLSFYIKPAFWQMPAFWVFSAIALLGLCSFIIYKRVRTLFHKERETNRIEKQIAGLELNALQAQMNPHFIFNSLNAIQHYIIHNEEVAANDYLSRFARLMRLFLESSKNRYITLADELELLELYMSLEKLRFEDKFDYAVDLCLSCASDALIPSMMIQPFIENAINHGLIQQAYKGNLQVSFVCCENSSMLKCTIEDNGIGRTNAARIKAAGDKKHISRGMQLIKERIRTYNFIEESDIEIHIIDKEYPHEGTIVELTLPVRPAIKKSPSYDKSNYY
jgi:ligand-binding sensor domain-containing protein